MKTVFRCVVLILILSIVSLPAFAQSRLYADVNGDGEVNVSDVNAVIDVILGGVAPSPDPDPDGHEYVDLGLPSGTLWATMNVGASSPEGYGDYFAWGETIPKEVYTWETYKWCNGSHTTLTKYCNFSSLGYNWFVDYKTELDLADDAAYVNWGASWRMPTFNQLKELEINCTWKWITLNGVSGQLVTGPNGNTMFLPAAGHRGDDSLYSAGLGGFYWSRMLNTNGPDMAYHLYFESDYMSWLYYRHSGHTIRAVRVLLD